MKKLRPITKEFLEFEYHTNGKSWRQIAEMLNMKPAALYHYKRIFNIKSRKTTKTKDRVDNKLGKKYNLLTVIEFIGTDSVGNARWLCRCDCGKEKIVRGKSLLRDRVKSCGCLNWINGRKNKRWTGYEDISGDFWSTMMNRAKQRGHDFTISIEEAWNQFIKQGRKCLFSGIDLIFTSGKLNKSKQTASLDRIDSSKGYTIDNICWVHKEINKMKLDHSVEHFIELCESVAKNKEIAIQLLA